MQVNHSVVFPIHGRALKVRMDFAGGSRCRGARGRLHSRRLRTQGLCRPALPLVARHVHWKWCRQNWTRLVVYLRCSRVFLFILSMQESGEHEAEHWEITSIAAQRNDAASLAFGWHKAALVSRLLSRRSSHRRAAPDSRLVSLVTAAPGFATCCELCRPWPNGLWSTRFTKWRTPQSY